MVPSVDIPLRSSGASHLTIAAGSTKFVVVGNRRRIVWIKHHSHRSPSTPLSRSQRPVFRKLGGYLPAAYVKPAYVRFGGENAPIQTLNATYSKNRMVSPLSRAARLLKK